MHEIFFIRNYKILALIFHSGVFLHGVSRGPFIAESEMYTSVLSSFSGMLVFLTGVGNNQGIAQYDTNPYTSLEY